jgi:HTH-type transcriptional regulator, transcriptional repressor of NAD biosynthesis genes
MNPTGLGENHVEAQSVGHHGLAAYWAQLEPVQRATLTVRVCCVGAESTGKSTLVQALAKRHGTASIHEYGRDYTVAKKTAGTNDSWDLYDFIRIAEVQQEMEDTAALDAGPLLFCDTDAMSTDLWCERYLGSRDATVNRLARSRRYDLFVLCDIDIPWEADGIRLGAESRAAMHQRFVEVLSTERPEPWLLVSGEVVERMDQVDAEIERLGLLLPEKLFAAQRFLTLEGAPYSRGSGVIASNGSQQTEVGDSANRSFNT